MVRKDTRFMEEYGIFREVRIRLGLGDFPCENGLRRQRRMTTWIKYEAVIAVPLAAGIGVCCFSIEEAINTGGSKYENRETGGESVLRLLVEVK